MRRQKSAVAHHTIWCVSTTSAAASIGWILSNHAEIGNLFMQNILMDCFVLWLIAIPVFLLVRYLYQKAKGETAVLDRSKL